MTQQRVSPVIIRSQLPATVTQIVQGASGQSADLMQWQSSTGTVLASISSGGLLRVGNTNTDAQITANATASVDGIRLRNSGGTLVFWGPATTGQTMFVNGNMSVTGGGYTQGRVSVDTQGTTSIGITVRGVASQTANLQEWQNSAGTVVAYVASGGAARFDIVQGGSSAEADLRGASSGGILTLKKATAAASYFGTDQLRLYVRDGTNAGTLKLVVRAGTAGAETTILDNIPQT
jgi:hypothetical protein